MRTALVAQRPAPETRFRARPPAAPRIGGAGRTHVSALGPLLSGVRLLLFGLVVVVAVIAWLVVAPIMETYGSKTPDPSPHC
jgi:hypothetical protein